MRTYNKRNYNKRTLKKHIKGGDDEKKQCIDTTCSKSKFEEFHKKTIVVFDKLLKDTEKKLKKKDITEEEKKNLEEDIKIQKDFIKKLNNSKSKEKSIKILRDSCERIFCNKGCFGTIFEDGDPNKLPVEFAKKFKGNKELLKLLTEERKEMFGKKNTVLKDNFYQGLKKSTVNKTKKNGAISGCVKMVLKAP